MISYIDGKLNQWGLWTLTGYERTGYPKRSAFVRVVSVGGGQVTICDDEAMQINRAVQALSRELRLVVDLVYVKMRNSGVEAIAMRLHCCRDTVYSRLHQSHLKVMDALHDEEFGIDLRYREMT